MAVEQQRLNLRIEQDRRVRRVTLAAVAQRNIVTAQMARDLLRELADAEADPETGAVLIDAEGPVFCGGLDPTESVPEDLFTFGARTRKPVIAAVQGVAFSAGVALVANAHIAVGAQGSTFGLTDVREGVCHQGVLRAIAGAVGERRARELALTGRVFSTPDALAWGLLHSVAPAFELEDRVTAIAASVAKANPEVVRGALALGR